MRTPSLRLALFFALGALALLAGCKGNCRQLSEKLCDCSLTPNDQTICLTRAGNNESTYGTISSDEDTCGKLIKTCDCHLITTAAGKKACGLAR